MNLLDDAAFTLRVDAQESRVEWACSFWGS